MTIINATCNYINPHIEFGYEIKGITIGIIDIILKNYKIGFRIDFILKSSHMIISSQDNNGFPVQITVPILVEKRIKFKGLRGEMYIEGKHIINLTPDIEVLEINSIISSMDFSALIGIKEIEQIERLIRGKDYLNIGIDIKFSYELTSKKDNVNEDENNKSVKVEYKLPRCEWKRLINIDPIKSNLDEKEILYYFYKNKLWIDDSPANINTIISNFITKFGEDDIKYVLDILCEKKYIYRNEHLYGILKNDYIKIEKLIKMIRFKYWSIDNLQRFTKYLKEHPFAILVITILILELISFYTENKALGQILANFTDAYIKP